MKKIQENVDLIIKLTTVVIFLVTFISVFYCNYMDERYWNPSYYTNSDPWGNESPMRIVQLTNFGVALIFLVISWFVGDVIKNIEKNKSIKIISWLILDIISVLISFFPFFYS